MLDMMFQGQEGGILNYGEKTRSKMSGVRRFTRDKRHKICLDWKRVNVYVNFVRFADGTMKVPSRSVHQILTVHLMVLCQLL